MGAVNTNLHTPLSCQAYLPSLKKGIASNKFFGHHAVTKKQPFPESKIKGKGINHNFTSLMINKQ